MENIINELKNKGFTKYRIAKIVGVSWNTVHAWAKGNFKPRNDKLKILKKTLELERR